MNKYLTSATVALIATISHVQGAALVAGWDFSNWTSSTATVETLFTGATSMRSPYSDITGDGLTTSNGRLYWDGTNGSTNLGNDGTGVAGSSTSLTTNLNLGSELRPLNTYLNTNYKDKQVQRGFLVENNSSGDAVVFGINSLGGGFSVYDSFSYAGTVINNGSSSITWAYSVNDGGSWVDLGTDNLTAQGSAGSLFGYSLASAGAGNGGELLLRATFGTIINTQEIIIDNVSVYGAVPEPSTYAMIAGVLVLGVAYIRRRRSV